MYLVGMVGLWLVLSTLLARRRAPESRAWRRPIPALVAVAVGGLAFVPWLPTFIYQSKHTGTPWALPANFAGVVNAVTGFTLNQASMSTLSTNQGRALAVIYFALAALALFGIGRTGRIVELDLHTRPRARAMSFVVIGTLFGHRRRPVDLERLLLTVHVRDLPAFSADCSRWVRPRCSMPGVG